jgi:hypothetical protein
MSRFPDDVVADLKARYGDVQYVASTNLARSRGVSLRDVLLAVDEDRLADIVSLPHDGLPTRAQDRDF